MPGAIGLERILRRLKPDKHIQLAPRAETQLPFVDSEPPAGPPLLLDTSVYVHVLKGQTPTRADELLRARTIYHAAPVIGELVHRLGSRIPANAKEEKAHRALIETIKDIPAHRIVSPSAQIWAEAGILAGIRARTGGFQARSQDTLNDALIFLQARETGAVVLTANIGDFDIFQQIVPNGRVIFYRAMP